MEQLLQEVVHFCPEECTEDQRNAKQKLLLLRILLTSCKGNYLEQNV